MPDMYKEILDNITKRMMQYNGSLHPTDDEVRIAWLVDEVDRLRRELLDIKIKH